ncbi:unnamed protein product [Parascedosporium putredinis]|uniref:Ubiquitination network signaling protein n=1 Tax=Parascedosporium putredinis TaxID=1442378 RepID=A0A9P1GYZ3_9PEZI|nr:unnamed protein product [Parascedosporium putredinis]CAI7991149.1 unnamed protein product [Parascedosporium putredinis]
MPRGTASGKRQQGASGNSSKNDNGVSRQANLLNPSATASAASSSQSSLNLSLNGSANGSTTPPVAANGRTNGHAATPNGNHNGFAKLAPADDMVPEHPRAHQLSRRASLGADSETSTSTDSFHSHHHVLNHANGSTAIEPRQIDVNASKYATDVHKDSGPLDFAATVLMALPLHDTLAILLILMHVSPLTLSVIYTVFTVLTFASPLTASSVVNIHLAELLDWHSTMPSLVTVLCVDILALLVFLFLWPSVQNAILDLAKPVIAATLGGDSHDPLEEVSRSAVSAAIRHPDPYFTLLGVHILMQGIVRYIREWYIRRERSSAAASAAPGDGTCTNIDDADNGVGDINYYKFDQLIIYQAKAEAERSGPPAAAPMGRAGEHQGGHGKEYELSHATSESACADATDIHNLGNAPFDREAGRIWISYVGCDEVSFDTSHFSDDFSDPPESSSPPPLTESSSAALDQSKPFYVRINNAHWLSTRIVHAQDNSAEETDDDATAAGTRWTGDIYGLRPMSKYVCEFVDTHTDAILFSTTVTTTRETRMAAVVNGAPTPQRRPHSPATTLRTSIAASDGKLAGERSRLKTLRKEWKAKINSLKKENEITDNSINTAGGTDDRFRQKIRQQETQKSQADNETSELSAELKAFDDAPSDVVSRRKQVEGLWTEEKAVYEAAQKEFKSYSASVNSAVKAKEGDQQQLQTRRNKVANRVAKVDNELANIADANTRGLNEVERRKAERETWQRQVSAAEERLNSDFNSVQVDNSILQEEHATAMQTANSLYAQLYAATTAPAPVPTYDMADHQRHNLPRPTSIRLRPARGTLPQAKRPRRRV